MPRIFLSLGSNVDPERNLRLAVSELRRTFGETRLSPVYRNEAVGFEGDDFLNLVAACDAECSIEDVVDTIERIHGLAGRQRGEAKFSSRPLDIDLLLYGELSTVDPVSVPREDVLRYSFVLKPLADIAPESVHPETGRTFADHWSTFDPDAHPLVVEPIELY